MNCGGPQASTSRKVEMLRAVYTRRIRSLSMTTPSSPPAKQMLLDPANPPDLHEQSILENGPTNASIIEPDVICVRCKAKKSGRNLVVCFDGTSNQFGENNTNVVELYHRITKDDDDRQLTYYNSGIGTYARPSMRSVKYLKQVLANKIDLAIAWNFEAIILKGYRWLADQYKPGDQIFLFGFSRGAYQIRALAAMIEKVGLILPGNEEQIPFAYELYADLRSNEKGAKKTSAEIFNIAAGFKEKFSKSRNTVQPEKQTTENIDLATRFKETFSRKDVKVHFVGNWDAVSSIGVFRGKTLPHVDEYKHICYFRHALALDERRVKFLPEYICGGESTLKGTSSHKAVHADISINGVGDIRLQAQLSNAIAAMITDVIPKSTVPRVKEVWFTGSHSDIGGGIVSNTELNNAAIPVMWMGNEALMAGLKLSPSKVEWDWKKLEKSTPTNSLSFIWRFFEFLPFERMTYANRNATTWWPHLARGRVIKPGQKIHASVAFVKSYNPKATFAPGMTDKNWSEILEKGHHKSFDWVSDSRLGELLEMDLFDLSAASDLFKKLRSGELQQDISGRLRFISLSDDGAREIIAEDPGLEILLRMLHSDIAGVRTDSRDILGALSEYEFSFPAIEKLVDSIDLAVFPNLAQGNPEDILRESLSVANLLRKLCEYPRPWDEKIIVEVEDIMAMARMAMSAEPRTSLRAFQALKCVCGRARRTDAILQDGIERFTAAGDEAPQIAGAWMINMLIQSPEIRIISTANVFSCIIGLLRSKSYPVKASAAHLLANLSSDDAVLTTVLKDENIDLLCELLMNDPSEWTDGILRVFEAFTRHEMFRRALSGTRMIDRLKRMLESSAPGPNMAGSLLGIFSEYSEFEQVVSGILPQLEIMLLSVDPYPRAMATNVLVEISRHEEMRSATLTKSIVRVLINVLKSQNFLSLSAEVSTALVEITQYKEFQRITSEVILQIMLWLNVGGPYETINQFLIDMLKHREVRSTILQKHGDIFPTFTNIRQGVSLKMPASTLLEEISQYEEFRPVILNANIMPFLSSMLQSGEEVLETKAASILFGFLKYDEMRVAMAPTEFVPQLLAMLEKVSGRILRESRGITMGAALRRGWTWPRKVLPTLLLVRLAIFWQQRIRRRWKRIEAGMEIPDLELPRLPNIRLTPRESKFRLPTCMQQLPERIPLLRARKSRREELGNGIHKLITWPPALPKLEGLPRLERDKGPEWLERQAEKPIRSPAASLAGSLLVAMYHYEEFRPVILQAGVVPSLLMMWQRRDDGLISVVTESLSSFYEYNEFREMIPSAEIVNQLVDLLRFYDDELTDELIVLKNLTKYPECRDAMLRRNMLAKLPATIKYAELSAARIAVDLLRQCAQYDEFWNAKPPSNLASCLASCVSNIGDNGQWYEEAASWLELLGTLKDMYLSRFSGAERTRQNMVGAGDLA